jgi:hypothetical protein
MSMPTWNNYNPGRAEEWSQWKQHAETYGCRGGYAGSTFEQGLNSTTGSTSYSGTTGSTSYSGGSSGYSSAGSQAGGGGAIVLLVIAYFVAVSFRDEIIIALGGLAATAIIYKIVSLSPGRRIVPLLVALFGFAFTGFAEYRVFESGLPAGAVTDQLWSWIGAGLNNPIAATHSGLILLAICGVATAFVTFFLAKTIKQVVIAPVAVLGLTAVAVCGGYLYQSFSTKEPATAGIVSSTQSTAVSVIR